MFIDLWLKRASTIIIKNIKKPDKILFFLFFGIKKLFEPYSSFDANMKRII